MKKLVEADAERRLRQSCFRELHHVGCEFRDGVLTLWGRVSSYHMKQMVQTLVLGMAHVSQVQNEVEVA